MKIKALALSLVAGLALSLSLAAPASAATSAEAEYVRGYYVDYSNSFSVRNTGAETATFEVVTDEGETSYVLNLAPGFVAVVQFPRDAVETITVTDVSTGAVVATASASRYDSFGNKFKDIVTGETVTNGVVKKEAL